jgi:NADP-dependent 3-hydroxy acid dehydrogenase YdfG
MEIALILLRNNARVIVTTRFPKNAVEVYAKQPDFEQWKDRLDIFGVDFKQIPKVYEFVEEIKPKYERLDILINNAC